MKVPNTERSFFIGWAPPTPALRPFLVAVAVLLCLAAFFAAYAIGATQNDPGDGGRIGRAMAVGVVETAPYPILHILDSEDFETGETILLMGNGKNGAQRQADPLNGQVVVVNGFHLARGELSGMILRGGQNGMAAAEAVEPQSVPEPEDLGRWRLSGEICDGNCYAGAMRPGTGLAHRACANLCILSGLPPVFVATDQVAGSEFFLIGGPDGGPIPEELLDHTGTLVQADGRVERRGSMNVFLIEPDSVEFIR